MKKLFLFLFFTFFLFLLTLNNTSADLPIEVCKVPQGQIQSSQPPTYPANNILYSVGITSTEAGSLTMACGVATFGASVERSNVKDIAGAILSRANILQELRQAGHLTATNAGSFDEYISGVKIMLNRDPVNCYRLTVKRINLYADPPVLTLPAPAIQTNRNLQTITYKPYNFRVGDIASAIQSVISSGGVGLGGVEYNSAGTDIAAHMFQPVGINPTPIILPNETRYAMKIYDPYFGITRDVQIAFDAQNRMYSNIWASGGVDRWFHLEELYALENLGSCTNVAWYQNNTNNNQNNTNNNNSGGGSGRVITRGGVKGPGQPIVYYTPAPIIQVKTPTTRVSCGLRNAANNACTVGPACPAGEYCSLSLGCACKTPVCGDNEKAPTEQCDDGNTVSGDGCSSTCQSEVRCGVLNPVWVSGPLECTLPGSYCHIGSIITGVCNNVCKCVGGN